MIVEGVRRGGWSCEALKLRGPGTLLDLTIESGPDLEGWCRVRVALDTQAGRWEAAEPCLTGLEVARLADWLDATASGESEGRLEFLEPELAFDRSAAGTGRLRVEFRWGLRPVKVGEDQGEPFCVDMPADPGQLRRAANWLRSWLARHSR